MPASLAGNNDKSGTVRVRAANVSLYNLNIENTYGHPVSQSQAIALSAQADRFGGYGLQLRGSQDTLLANGPGGEYFSGCLIEGAVDFVRHGVFHCEKCNTHRVADLRTVCVRLDHEQRDQVHQRGVSDCKRTCDRWYPFSSFHTPYSWLNEHIDGYWYVIDHSLITGDNRNGTSYLGRPWRNYARVVYQESFLDANINPAGWQIWTGGYVHGWCTHVYTMLRERRAETSGRITPPSASTATLDRVPQAHARTSRRRSALPSTS
jgi:pectinesterase